MAKKLEAFHSKFLGEKRKLHQDQEQFSELQQLNSLFDQITSEIHQRQQDLEKLQDIKCKELKEEIKREIVEKISELEKITRMIKKINGRTK